MYLEDIHKNKNILYSELGIVYMHEDTMRDTILGIRLGIQYSLVNTVWNTASTGSYGGTIFPGGICYSLVNNVCGVRYSLEYRIHSDIGMTF